MDSLLLDGANDKISQHQRLELQSKIISYINEAMSYDNGYLVFECKDLGEFDFDYYYSSGSEIMPRYDETREESIARILFTINCREFNNVSDLNTYLNKIMVYIYNYVVGFISGNVLFERYKIRDHSFIFKQDAISDEIESQ